MHNLAKIHNKIQSLNLDDDVLKKIIDKYNLSKLNKSVSSNYALRKPSTMLCSCQECNKVLQNCHFSQEAFQSLSDHIDQINNVIKTSCDFLAVSCPNEILQYKHTKANLKCVDAQIKLSILFFQFLI